MFSFSCYMFVIVSLVDFLTDFHVSACDEDCVNKTVFTPSRLVVKHGDPASAYCTLCPSCPSDTFNLERPIGDHVKNGTTITWTVNSIKEWTAKLICYYFNTIQCCTELNVTVYKPPDLVSIGFKNHSGPLFESRHYTLECEVQNVAPITSVTVTFFRDQTELDQVRSSSAKEGPVTEVFTLGIDTTPEDDGAQYWCQAKLELGPDGPETPPMVKSKNVTATVYYKPQQLEPSPPGVITLTKGYPLQLNCSAVGNPSPSYTWTVLPAGVPPSNSSVLTIQSVAYDHEGQYNCSVSNDLGTNTVMFRVVVTDYITKCIIGAVAVFSIIILIVGAVLCYRNSRKGKYSLKKVFRLGPRHVAVPTVE